MIRTRRSQTIARGRFYRQATLYVEGDEGELIFKCPFCPDPQPIHVIPPNRHGAADYDAMSSFTCKCGARVGEYVSWRMPVFYQDGERLL